MAWFMSTWLYRFISLHIIPHLYYWFSPNRPIDEFYDMEDLIAPGDFLVSTSRFKLTHLIISGIGGYPDHAAIYIGDGKVIEMVGTGWNKIPLRQFWREATNMAVIRLKKRDKAYASVMIQRALDMEGVEYDLWFEPSLDFLYCSELCGHCDIENRAEFNLDDLKGLGRKYLSPKGVMYAKGCEIVYDTHS
jgi:uncharacterized protein YycO